jgi:hypothetical protein
VRSAVDLFHSRWWTIGWTIAVVAFFAHVAALSLLPLSLAQAVLSGGFFLLAVLPSDTSASAWAGVNGWA